jgi:4a-hydroxytetrahydrobiopterin dehydratase
MPDRLDDVLVKDALHGLPAWTGDSRAITRTVEVDSAKADELVSAVAKTAEAMDHHPEVQITPAGLVFVLSTHSAEGVTVLDIALASTIEDLVSATTGQPAQHGEQDINLAVTAPDAARSSGDALAR